MSKKHRLILNEEVLEKLPEPRRSIFIYEWLQNLIKVYFINKSINLVFLVVIGIVQWKNKFKIAIINIKNLLFSF